MPDLYFPPAVLGRVDRLAIDWLKRDMKNCVVAARLDVSKVVDQGLLALLVCVEAARYPSITLTKRTSMAACKGRTSLRREMPFG